MELFGGCGNGQGGALTDATRIRPFRRSSQEPETADDDALWAEVCDGDQRAFGVLFDRYADLIYNVAFRRTGSWDVARTSGEIVVIPSTAVRSVEKLTALDDRPLHLVKSIDDAIAYLEGPALS